ncbi:MAG: alanine racemase [Ruminococcus sp.]|nr:alanine racemase [Ruminococcus sp.]
MKRNNPKEGLKLRKLAQRTEAVVSLGALEHNVNRIRSIVGSRVEIMAVLKGDGYGHGEKGIYPTLKKCGIERYAVAVWEEGASLRKAGCTEPILLLGDTCDLQLENLIKYNLTPAIFSVDTAEKLNMLAKWSGIVQPVHIKIDTGMSRIGFSADKSSVEVIKRINSMTNLKIEGAFTHFSRADEPDGLSAKAQFEKYIKLIELLEAEGVHIPCKHVANSPAVLLRPETRLDAVRPGDILFGLCPIDEDEWEKADFRQVMSWYTYVVMVKEVPAGTEVGYGGTYVTRHPTKIATIPVGFADGYSRELSNIGKVRINGHEAPIIGRVCMDQFMVDVTGIGEVRRGDTVSLLDDKLSVLWMADLLGRNVDEIVCGISKRVPRIYEA